MTLPPVFTLTFWFSLTPQPLAPWIERTLLIAFLVMLVGGVAVRIIAMRKTWEKMMRRAMIKGAWSLVVLGLFGLFLLLLEYERIRILSLRAGFLFWAALCAWYAWSMYRFVYIQIPEMKARQAERERQNKWLPKSN